MGGKGREKSLYGRPSLLITREESTYCAVPFLSFWFVPRTHSQVSVPCGGVLVT